MNSLKIFFILLSAILSTGCTTQHATSKIANEEKRTFIPVLGGNKGFWSDEIEILKNFKASDLHIRVIRVKKGLPEWCPEGFDQLQINGPINQDTTFIIEKTLKEIRTCPESHPVIYLNSNGGRLTDGFALGNVFRQQKAMTIIDDGQFCASSCAIAYLGGRSRAMNGNAKILFHAPYVKSGFGIDCPSKPEVSLLLDYFDKMVGNKSDSKSSGKMIFERAMSYCSQSDGWELNSDVAFLYNITNIRPKRPN